MSEGSREWWIEFGEECDPFVMHSKPQFPSEAVHVIEYAEYLRVVYEREELQKLKDKAADIAIAIGIEHNQKVKELAEARAEVERLKYMGMRSTYRELADENNKLRAQLAKKGGSRA